MQFDTIYHDGKTSRGTAVVVRIDDVGTINICGDELQVHYPVNETTRTPRLGNLLQQLRFPDGASCDIPADCELDAYFLKTRGSKIQDWIHLLESKRRFILVAALLAVGSIWGLIEFVIPVMANHVAKQIPLSVEANMGKESLAFFDKTLFAPSEIPAQRQDELRQKFRAIADNSDRDILFRSSKAIGANAFALPSGIIVFTDGMINLAEDDDELLGVFAHELGHVKHRHVMRHILQDSATALILLMLTGDVGSASSFAATIPVLLTQAKFSRAFEHEADDFAAARLQQHGINPAHLGNLLKRLTEGKTGQEMPGFLSSHPPSVERAKFLDGFVDLNTADRPRGTD